MSWEWLLVWLWNNIDSANYVRFTGSIVRSASRWNLIYSEADFEVFRRTWATSCTVCKDRGIGPQNWKRIPCAIFTKFAEYVPRFRTRCLLKFCWICSRSYGVIGVLRWWGPITPKFSAPPSGETMHQTPKVLEVQEHDRGPLSPCQVWWGSDFTRSRGSQKRWAFLSVCLFVTLLNVSDCVRDFAIKALEYRKC